MILISTKKDKTCEEFALHLIKYLKERIPNQEIISLDSKMKKLLVSDSVQKRKKEKKNNFSEGFIFAVGDDELILETFKETAYLGLPLLGISAGSSFFAEADFSNYKKAIDKIRKGDFEIFSRSRICANINGRLTDPVLNEIGIFPKRSATLLRYTLLINGEVFWRDTADGIIISTPTGSTGHSFSAGGPIVLKEPGVFIITPVTSMDRTHTPIVISNTSHIEIGSIQCDSGVCLYLDGKEKEKLNSERIVLQQSAYPAKFIKFSKEESLQQKLKKRDQRTVTKMISNMPPSVKLIYRTLQQRGELTQKEIIDETMLPERTVRHALEKMFKQKILNKKTNLTDARQAMYALY